MSTNFEPGFFQDVPFADYLADPAINNSGLKILSQSAAKFAYWRDNQKPATPSQLEGSGLHCAILQPEFFEKSFGKEAAPRKGSAARTEWEEDNPRAVALTPGQWKNVHNMAKSFENTPCTIAKELLKEGTPELSVWFDDPLTGLRCKIRPDFLKDDDIVIDLKSTKNGSPAGFYWEIKKYGYNYQAAFYKRGVDIAYASAGVKRKVKAFIIIAIENFAPYEVACYMISEEVIAEAQIQINANLERYKECLISGIWPGYPNRIMVPGDQGEILYD